MRARAVADNSNFGVEEAITMPNPVNMEVAPFNRTEEHIHHFGKPNQYDGALCYQGATARAIELAANEFGYVIVNVTRGLDLFLVRKDLWHWPVPTLNDLNIHQCINLPMSVDMAVNLLDYERYTTSASMSHQDRVCKANRAAQRTLRRIGQSPGSCPCFKHMNEPWPVPPACRGQQKHRERDTSDQDVH
jgi:hypothetical protein